MSNNPSKPNLEREIRALFDELAQHDPFDKRKNTSIHRIEARLIKMSFPTVPYLIEALRRQEWPLSYHAVGILGEIGDEKAIPDLVASLPHEDIGEKAGKALQKFGPPAVPEIVHLMKSAITPIPDKIIPAEMSTINALITLGNIRCDDSIHFLNTLLDEYMEEVPQKIFDPKKHEWRFRNIDFFLLLDAMVKQQDERAIPHIKKIIDIFSKECVENTVCRIAIGRIRKKKPEGYLPLEYLDIAMPSSAFFNPLMGKKFCYEDYIEEAYGEYLCDDKDWNEIDSNEDTLGEDYHLEDESIPEGNDAPMDEFIGPYTRTIEIEHEIGETTYVQSLTVPRRRPFKNIHQFKLTLIGTDPPVWRRILIPENYTFYELHVAMQDVMEWRDYHLHHFEIPVKKNKRSSIHIECPWWEPWDMEADWLITTEVPVKEFLKNPSDKALYRYDYGDGWEMNVILEKILPKKKNSTYPICIDGELAAPPEDCGGIPGYYRCIEAFEAADDLDKIPDTEEKEELVERLVWLSGWNPYLFLLQKLKFDSPRERFKKAL